MKIGIMLRSFDEKGGVGVYTQNIVRELLALQSGHHFVLFYRQKANIGTFADYENVTERYISGKNKLYWDQIAIPRACRREWIDVLFHPKFTAPFLAPCPVVMVVHGADWFMPDQHQFYTAMDVRYIRTIMPWYFRKCTTVISVSQLTTDNFNAVLNLPAEKVKTVYFGPAGHFVRITEIAQLEAVRAKYHLPARFLFTLTKLTGDKRKNLGNLLRAYACYHEMADQPLPLVVGGKDCFQLRAKYEIPDDGYGADIYFPGWIDQADLPAIYSQATAYIYPSNLEAFPIPLTEAMACGTPIITSDVNGLKEIAGEAGVFVSPTDVKEIAKAMLALTVDLPQQQRLSQRGLDRAQLFSWPKCAKETMALLTAAARLGKEA